MTKTERRKTPFSLKRLERIGKILAIVVAVLTIVTTIVTAAQWFFAPATRTPVIVVREFTPLPDHRGMLVRFSISNRATEPLYVDRIYFVQRQPAWAGAMAWIASTVRSVVLGLDDVRVKADAGPRERSRQDLAGFPAAHHQGSGTARKGLGLRRRHPTGQDAGLRGGTLAARTQ